MQNLGIIIITFLLNTYSIISYNNKTNEDRNLKTILLEYPDIILIGAMKSGTGSFHKLVVDASLNKVCGFGEKEKHFFNNHEYILNYKAHVQHYISQFSGCTSNQLTMDSTPGYSVNEVDIISFILLNHCFVLFNTHYYYQYGIRILLVELLNHILLKI